MNITGPEALAKINTARTAADIFGAFTGAGAPRQARRHYRILAACVHPDRAAMEGIEAADAEKATVKLNELFTAFTNAGAKPAPPQAKPHVVGTNGTYELRDKLRATDLKATYATDKPRTFVTIARTAAAGDAATATAKAAKALVAAGLPAFVPEVLDAGVTSDRAWLAYQLPEGMYTLAEVKAAYPNGLDARDWAWMVRRILIILDAAGTAHGALGLDAIHIHPEQHGVILTDFEGAGDDNAALAPLFETMLDPRTPGAARQLVFANAATRLTPKQLLREYDLLLRFEYGERRFRPFTIDAKA